MTKTRLDYIDNIRILLTAVVILNHLSITYGAPGGWYYREFEIPDLNLIPMAALVIFAAFNQAYSMGFFFLISGFFTAKSISGSDTKTFLAKRLVRLGIPVLLYVYLLSPILRLSFRRIAFNIPITIDNVRSVYQHLEFGYELGPMWFILLLLIFSLIFPIILGSIKHLSKRLEKPGRSIFLASAAIMGMATFVVRIPYPVGTVFQPLNLQTPHLVQYIFMFLAGVLIQQANWQEDLEAISLKFWLSFTIGLILVMPILFILVGGPSGDVTSALGGFSWQSLIFSLWEQIFAVSMVAAIVAIFFKYLNKNYTISRELAASSYATYIFHPLVLVLITALLRKIHVPPLMKIALLAGPVLVLCFSAASLLRRLPGLKSII